MSRGPSFDPALCVDDVVEVAVQVNGKVQGRIMLLKDATEASAREVGSTEENVVKHLEDKSIRKVVYVAGRIVNFIVG